MNLELELETRACRQCLRSFRVLSTSPQTFHSELCKLEFDRVPGNKEAWLKKQKEISSRLILSSNGASPMQREKNILQAQAFKKKLSDQSMRLRSEDSNGVKNIKEELSTKEPSSENGTQKTAPKPINAELQMNKNVLPPTLITETVKGNIRGNGMQNTEKNTKNAPALIDDNVTPLPAWTRQLKHIKEEISQQTNLLDSSAKFLYSQMEANKGNPTDVVMYSQGIVNLMRAKTEAIKATTEIIKTMKELGE